MFPWEGHFSSGSYSGQGEVRRSNHGHLSNGLVGKICSSIELAKKCEW